MLNSSDQMSVLLPAVASTDFVLQTTHLHQFMGEWFRINWKRIISKALFFQKRKKVGIKSLEVRYLNIYTLFHALCIQDLVSIYCLTAKWILQYC